MRFSASAITLALVAAASAQTFTDCDPTKKSCPNDVGLPASTFSSNFAQDGAKANSSWSAAAYTTVAYGSDGAEFSIANADQAPTLSTDFYIFFGRIDIKMKAAKGQGIVSSIVLESDDLDEIDWEFIGSDNTQVQSNFYGKGNTTTYDRVLYSPVQTPTDLYHTYSIDWTAEKLQYFIDGTLIRTVAFADPLANYGKNYPQTPAKLKLGSWCGGCSKSQGTVEWAGGKATFGGEPYVMYVDSVAITNYNPADAYEWSDRSGDWQSIRIINGGKTQQPVGGSNGGQSAVDSGSAPTASVPVGTIHVSQTPSFKQTGSAYSTNHASVSAQNPGKPTGAAGNGVGGGVLTSTTTECPETESLIAGATGAASSMAVGTDASTLTSVAVVGPTMTALPSGTGTGSTGSVAGANGTLTSPQPSGPAQQSGNAASSLTVASGSLVGVLFGMLFL